jgi:hypothetical protein
LTIIGLGLLFGVLMGVRGEISSPAGRMLVAAMAGGAFGAMLILAQRWARQPRA